MSQGAGPPLDGRYELGRPVGGTPAAEVFRARDLQLDRPVAVKVLDAELSRDPAVVERFRRAASDAATLRGPNVVTVYDWGEAGGRAYVTMELVDGESLAQRLEHTPHLDLGTAAAVGVAVASALQVAHAAGQVHGSLTPRDVLLARDGSVKVTDFGTAAAGLASTETTPDDAARYAAPEQLRGGPATAASDLYALGAILVAAATGAPPFAGDAVTVSRRKLEESAPPPSRALPGLPPAFDAIAARLLEQDPARRYPSAADAASDLERLRETVVVDAAPPTRPVARAAPPTAVMPMGATALPAETPRRRSATPWIVTAVVLLLLIAGGVIAWAVTRDDGDDPEQVAVPAVVGQRVADANARLVDAGLSPSTVNEANDEFGEGLVFSQAPAAATMVRKGSVVVLKVSTGPTTTTTSSTTTSSTTTTSTSTTTSTTTTSTTTTTTPP